MTFFKKKSTLTIEAIIKKMDLMFIRTGLKIITLRSENFQGYFHHTGF